MQLKFPVLASTHLTFYRNEILDHRIFFYSRDPAYFHGLKTLFVQEWPLVQGCPGVQGLDHLSAFCIPLGTG